MPSSLLSNLRQNLSDFWNLTFFRPNVFRQTPFRLTLVFLSVYLFVAMLVFGYIWLATSTESRAWGNSSIDARVKVLKDLDQSQGHAAVVGKILSDEAVEWGFAKGVFDSSGTILAQNTRTKMEGRDLPDEIIRRGMENLDKEATSFNLTYSSPNTPGNCCRFQGRIVRFDDDFYVFVAMDMSWADHGFQQEVNAAIGGGVLVILLGLFAGTLINQEVTRSVTRVTNVLSQVQEGDLKARIAVRETGDEFDALAARINQTLDRMEKTMGNLKYAGDAIAHDLRSPLSRLRSKLEVSLFEVDRDPSQAHDALQKALDETDQLLRTFHTVFAISRLQAAGQAPDQVLFPASDLANDMAELYEAVAADKGLEFEAEIEPNVRVLGNRDFLAQALANLLDNAVKYTAAGGITFRLRRTSQREVEFSITDTGPGVPEKDRPRIAERFVRLENSRSLPGVGLGLAMVEAVAVAHKGRLTIDEGPGVFDGNGPGLRTALVLPPLQG
ncbi:MULTISPECIES: HAMP domain-containing sensor histidine kinase [Asticcacaulis]|uniref:sensor histidine kinase n=1 Tax=Asticcacaulis TaxID=76890 RepID=UPI001AE655CB|nr:MULTISPECIES: HAMP domain-containing sensor histidine kinase [Asticcacaulis]MBP2157769.1 signal transduction histidine kinase [Asticcacaulis solisilvae]MDR6798814.1 signal transduction histidine kinase [Asticcacaulis sp. BE141]